MNPCYAEPKNRFNPTDVELADGDLFVCDGYSKGNYVVRLDPETLACADESFGGKTSEAGVSVPGRFFTNHGVTVDPGDGTPWIADRGNRWVQVMTTGGEFLRGVETGNGKVCDVDFVDWRGERLVVDGRLFVLCYGWNPGAYAVLECVSEDAADAIATGG